jgi:2-polyprenyl-3-methyl-5-hydroxy-6-metoxy-1,4-benzoquinol methylase
MSDQSKLFRNSDGSGVKQILNPVEGISFQENPLDFYILLARYKFAARFLKKDMRVKDAGCGQGFGSVFLSRFCNSVLAVDFDQDLLDGNRQRYASVPNITFERQNLLDPNLEKNTFDALVSMDVIEHFEVEEQESLTSNFAASLKPKGFAVIGTPSVVSSPYASQRRKTSHIHEFEPQEFEEHLRRHFSNVFLFSMTDENVSTSFVKLAWYLMAICTK